MIKVVIQSNIISEAGRFSRGQIIGIDDKLARQWIEAGLAKVYTAPAETKVAGPEEKKSSPAAPDGLSTGMQSLIESGADELSPSAEGAPASQGSRPITAGRSRRSR